MAAVAATLILASAGLAIVNPLFDARGAAGEPVGRIAFPMVAGALLLVRLDPVIAVSPSVSSATVMAGLALFLLSPVAAFSRGGRLRAALLLACGQAGLVVAGLGIGAVRPALAHLLTVPLTAVLLMLAAGIAQDAPGEGAAGRGPGGIFAAMPATGRLLLAGAAAVAWVPPFAGFFSGVALLHAFSGLPGAGPFLRVGVSIGVILSAAAAANCAVVWLFVPPPSSVRHDPPLATLAIPALLALLLVAAGFFPVPGLAGESEPPGAGVVALLVAIGVAAGVLSGRRRGEGGRG
jgi:NADH:ubiquinone oxidoreductase subunit 5 (subunit L)/multisubunit Na+/H+ antiporter MnhA subunit